MTTLLDRAFSEAAKFSDLEQNVIAQWLLDEIVSEKNGVKLLQVLTTF